MGDFYNYDKQMWFSMIQIINGPQVFYMFMNFTYLYSEEKVHQKKVIQLVKNGANIDVANQNKAEYVNLFVNFLQWQVQEVINCLRNGINTVLPIQLISILEPHELNILLNGPQKINVKEWKQSCLYVDCVQHQERIEWFWKYLHFQDHDKLCNLLHFFIDSKRVPILGFFFGSSKRNNISRLTVKKVKCESKNPFAKDHTCCNTLELPTYSIQQELTTLLDELLYSQINTFCLS